MAATLLIRNVPVQFPFEAYPSQVVFMEKVLEAVQGSKDALLESPTGTGKTACLLAALLGWQASERASVGEDGVVPRIFYASRTHSQLAKVMKELGHMSYRPRTTLQGSRQQLCVHPKVKGAKPALKNAMCQGLVSSRSCEYHEGVARYVERTPHVGGVADIEDLEALGRRDCVCPYYLTRERGKTAEVTFLPYNYLVEPTARRRMSDELSKAVLVFDEAHNLDAVCAEATSFDLRDSDVSESCEALRVWEEAVGGAAAAAFTAQLQALLRELQAVQLGDHPGAVLVGAFERAGVTMQSADALADAVEAADTMNASAARASGLQALAGALRILFGAPKQLNETAASIARFYRLHVEARGGGRLLSYWCFHPGLALRVLRAQHDVRCLILASGTLSPMDALASELGLPFPIRLESPHVVDASKQLLVAVVTHGPNGQKLESTYANRGNVDLVRDLGRALVNFFRLIPDGVLVFFPSYASLEATVDVWQRPGESVWPDVLKHKRVVMEPREASQGPNAITEFQRLLQDGTKKGAVFFAVCRGKVAEGLDFADRNGRAVIIVGVPFPSTTDAKVVAKKKFLDAEHRRSSTSASGVPLLSGEAWYMQQAACAVNQAVGRVIRHRFDYGAMIFLDARFEALTADPKGSFLSSWIRPYVATYRQFGDVTTPLKRFFLKAPAAVEAARAAAEQSKRSMEIQQQQLRESERKRSAFAGRDDVADGAPAEPDAKLRKIERAQGFLSDAKATLSEEQYKTFQATMRRYKAKEITISTVIHDAIPLFLSVADEAKRAALLEGFEGFIPEGRRGEYLQVLKGLRPVPAAAAGAPVLQRRPSALGETIRERVAVTRARREQEAQQPPVVVDSKTPTPPPEPVPAPVPAPVSAMAEGPPGTDAHVCPICRDAHVVPVSAQCGHICCNSCWKSWLSNKLECPVCKEKVRVKSLRKVFF